MGDWRTEHPVENGSFPDDSVDWMDTPEGQQSIEALDLVFGALDYVDVDARQRKIVWTDGKRLSIEEAAERLHAEHPDIPRDLIETHVFGWLENCAPESYTDEQMDEFDQLMEPWLEDYDRKRSAGGK
jgi:hypothetical protein